MNILGEIFFFFYEKLKLRNWQGSSRAASMPHPERNDEFYRKLEREMNPLFEGYGFEKVKKGRFIKREVDKVCFYEFDLTKKRNGFKVSFGALDLIPASDPEILTGRQPLSSYGVYQENWTLLRPPHWNYDYEYPVSKDGAKDEKIIREILILLKQAMSGQRSIDG